jgi:hypothetical protein
MKHINAKNSNYSWRNMIHSNVATICILHMVIKGNFPRMLMPNANVKVSRHLPKAVRRWGLGFTYQFVTCIHNLSSLLILVVKNSLTVDTIYDILYNF